MRIHFHSLRPSTSISEDERGHRFYCKFCGEEYWSDQYFSVMLLDGFDQGRTHGYNEGFEEGLNYDEGAKIPDWEPIKKTKMVIARGRRRLIRWFWVLLHSVMKKIPKVR